MKKPFIALNNVLGTVAWCPSTCSAHPPCRKKCRAQTTPTSTCKRPSCTSGRTTSSSTSRKENKINIHYRWCNNLGIRTFIKFVAEKKTTFTIFYPRTATMPESARRWGWTWRGRPPNSRRSLGGHTSSPPTQGMSWLLYLRRLTIPNCSDSFYYK